MTDSLVMERPAHVGSKDGSKKPKNTARFFWTFSSLLGFAVEAKLTRDEMLLYLLHCRGYSKTERVSLMGEKSARGAIGLRRSEWEWSKGRLALAGLAVAKPDAPICRPQTWIGSPGDLRPFARPSAGDRPELWDKHRYSDSKTAELIKMPWTLMDGGTDRSQPALGDLVTLEAVEVALALYLVATGDGVISPRFANVRSSEDGLTFKQSLAAILTQRDAGFIERGLAELVCTGLLYPACEMPNGSQQLRLLHPFDTPRPSGEGDTT